MARILLIDDDDSLREVVRYILSEAGHEVVPASSGEDGLAQLSCTPDLVVSDIQLYLDLKGYMKRGEEAAEFLLERRLRKQW